MSSTNATIIDCRLVLVFFQGGRQSNEWQYYTCDSGILVTEANIRPHLAW